MTLRIGVEVTIDLEAGGRLSSLVLGGRERLLLEPCQADVLPSLAWGCFLMAPFVGRLSGGRVSWQGSETQVPCNHGAHAIHGLAFDIPWQATSVSPNALVITAELDSGTLAQRIAIARGKLLLEAEIRAEEAMPAALGWHPWFRRDGEVRVGLAAEQVLTVGRDTIPTGGVEQVSGETDLRDAPFVDGRTLDHVYSPVRSPAFLTWPDLELQMAFEPPVQSVVVFVHPQAVCVEPMTAWPDAISLEQAGAIGTGLATLQAGERLAASTTWTWQPR